MGLVVTLGDSASAFELIDAQSQTEVEATLTVADFARGEIGRLNSIVGASISDLEFALELDESDTADANSEAPVRDALTGCRQIADFLRVLGRINSLEGARRREQRLKSCVTDGVDRARKRCKGQAVAFVVQIDSERVFARYDYDRVSQAVGWLGEVVAAALDRAKPGASNKLVDVSLRVQEMSVIVRVAQHHGAFEEFPYFLEIDLASRWRLEAARLLLAWEGIDLERFGSGEFGGFSFSVPRKPPLPDLAD